MSTTIKHDGFLLNCKVEGKSWGTIDCYADKLKGFLWYATTYDWSDDISEITTQHLREFLVYLRETEHRFNSKGPSNNTIPAKNHLRCILHLLMADSAFVGEILIILEDSSVTTKSIIILRLCLSTRFENMFKKHVLAAPAGLISLRTLDG